MVEPVAAYWAAVAVYNEGDVVAYAARFAPDATVVRPDWQARDRSQIAVMWAHELRSFPDRQLTVLCAAADGDTVLAEWLWQGTPATRPRRIDVRGMEIARFSDGLARATRRVTEELGGSSAGRCRRPG